MILGFNCCNVLTNRSKRAAALVLLAMLAAGWPASAADRTQVVKFPSGHSSVTLKGSIKSHDTSKFVVGASKGQTMSVLFSPSNASCYFNLSPPGGGEALHIGSISGNEFTDDLPATGDYTVQAYLMRNAARRNETCNFSLTIKVSG